MQKCLIVKEDGLIYAAEVPEEKEYCREFKGTDCQGSQCHCMLNKVRYDRALASAKESAVLVSNHNQAFFIIQDHFMPKGAKEFKLVPGIYPIPDLQWEVDDSHNPEKQGYTYGGGYAADMMAYNGPVAILKESKPLPHGSKCIMQDESIPFVEAHQLRSAEEIAYATWRKLVNQNWANVAGEIQTAIEEYAEGVEQELKAKFKSHSPIEQKNELELIIAEKNIDIIHLRDRIKELESQPLPIEGGEREWISVKDRLPEKFVKVLMWGSKGNQGIGCVDDSGIFDDYALWEGENVTHWQPLPSPPKNG